MYKVQLYYRRLKYGGMSSIVDSSIDLPSNIDLILYRNNIIIKHINKNQIFFIRSVLVYEKLYNC